MHKKLLALLIFAITISSQAWSEDFSLLVVHSSLPTQASALVLTDGNISEITVTKISTLADNQYRLDFSADQTNANSLISFNLIDSTGASAITSFRSIHAKMDHQTLSAALPACPEYNPPDSIYRSGSIIERLVELREERLENRSKELELLLNQEFITKIDKIEKGFGLKNLPPLATTMSKQELAARLTKARALLISYRMQQTQE